MKFLCVNWGLVLHSEDRLCGQGLVDGGVVALRVLVLLALALVHGVGHLLYHGQGILLFLEHTIHGAAHGALLLLLILPL